MDQIVPRVLKFGHFEVDHLRACVRVGERNIDLRPKAFDVLRYLAENAGRLVSKAELHDAVWGRVAVSDDLLVQCIRELRQKLGDADHALIKTVPRRGYLLDIGTPAAPVTSGSPDTCAAIPARAPVRGSAEVVLGQVPSDQGLLRGAVFGRRFRWMAGAAIGAALAAVIVLISLPRPIVPAPPELGLVSDLDSRRVAELAAEKDLPIPPFNIASPAADVPDTLRRFVGVWVSDDGWFRSRRQFMVIVTDANRDGDVSGYFVYGPSMPQSRSQGPALAARFTAHVKDGTLRYDDRAGMHLASVTRGGQMHFQLLHTEGGTGVVTLNPIWTLPKDGAAPSAQRARSDTVAARRS